MTWKAFVKKAAFVSAFAVMVTVVTLIAPTPPPPTAAAASLPHCATVEAQALISPDAPVAGAFECLSPEIAQANGFTSDADLQAVAAQPPILTSYRYLGHTPLGYYFEFTVGGPVLGCFRFHIDAAGHVDRLGSKSGNCPQPLP